MGTTRTSAVITLTITPDNSAPVWDGTLLYTIPRAEEWTLDLDTLVTGEPEPDITFDGSNFPSGWTWSFDAATHMLRVTPTTTGEFDADATATNSSGSADATPRDNSCCR